MVSMNRVQNKAIRMILNSVIVKILPLNKKREGDVKSIPGDCIIQLVHQLQGSALPVALPLPPSYLGVERMECFLKDCINLF